MALLLLLLLLITSLLLLLLPVSLVLLLLISIGILGRMARLLLPVSTTRWRLSVAIVGRSTIIIVRVRWWPIVCGRRRW